jgi:hypothetical protein
MARALPQIAAVTVLVVAGAAHAQIASSIIVLPVVAQLGGAEGTDWITSASISNVSEFAVEVTARYLEEGGRLLPILIPSHTFTLDPGETLTVDDVVGSWFPNQSDTKGTLVLTAEPADGGEDAALVVATARVFNNADPVATYGQAVAPGLFNIAMGYASSVLPGARWDDLFRTNLGVANVSFDAITVIITTYAADGSVLASRTRVVKALSLAQWSLKQLGVSDLSTPGRVEVRLDPDTITWDPCDVDVENIDSLRGVFIAYISRIDRSTGDAEYIPSQTDWTEFLEQCEELPI